MAIATITGKNCTFKIGTIQYEAWITSMDVSADRASDTVATWGEDVAFGGSATYTGTVEFLFDPNVGSLGEAMENAFADNTPVTIVVDMGGSTRTFTNWLVTAYSDNSPADGLVAGSGSLTGSALWTTTYKPAAAAVAE